jgi:hypothetical protein
MNWLGIVTLLFCLLLAWEVGVRIGIESGSRATLDPFYDRSAQRTATLAIFGASFLFVLCLIGGFLLEQASLSPFAPGRGWTASAIYAVAMVAFAIVFRDSLDNNAARIERMAQSGELTEMVRRIHDEMVAKGEIEPETPAARPAPIAGQPARRLHPRRTRRH